MGEKAFNHYVDYYCFDIELNPEARKQIQVVKGDGGHFKLHDSYGELEFTYKDLGVIKNG